MKFTISVKSMLYALTRASYVIPGKNAVLVAYTGVSLEVRDSQLLVTGTDGDTSVQVREEVSEMSPGTVLVAPKRLIKWLGSLPSGEETVQVTKSGSTQVVVTPSTGSPYTFRTLQATLPSIPKSGENVSAVDFTGLDEALQAVKSSAEAVEDSGKDQVVQVTSGDFGMRLHSTDRMRLTRAELPNAGFGQHSFILRIRSLELAAKLKVDSVEVDPKGRWVVFSNEHTAVTTRLLDVAFPPVEAVLDSKSAHGGEVVTADLQDCLARLSCVADESMPLLVDIDNSEVRLTMNSDNVGSGEEAVEINQKVATTVQFGVNLDYLMDAVRVMGPVFTLGWTSPVAPLLVRSSGVSNVTVVIMPIRLTES